MTDETRTENVRQGGMPRAGDAAGDGSDAGEDRRRDRGGPRPRRRRLSEILAGIAQDTGREYVSVSDLLHLLGGRARAALIFLFACPNILPTPPGTSAVLGLPLLYLTLQMMLGRIPWLPRLINDRALPRPRFAQLVEQLLPWLAKAERMLKPRWSFLVSHGAERPLGAFCLILAVVLALPIPLGNILPALSMCLIALGLLERDGIWVAGGICLGLAALTVVAGVIFALVKATLFVIVNAFP